MSFFKKIIFLFLNFFSCTNKQTIKKQDNVKKEKNTRNKFEIKNN